MNYISAFKTSVQQNADKPTLVDFDGTRQTTYKELDRLSSKVAGKLHAAGCSKGSFIPILIERRMEYIAAYLGVLKAGCVVVPLTSEIPWTRISYITNHCDAKLTIDISFFDDIESYEPFEDLAGDDEPALLIYTSGSTGTPKGILHTNRSLSYSAERLKSLRDGVNPFIFAAVAPLSFIVHVQEYLCPFLFGGCVHILSDTAAHSLPLLEEYYTKHSITAGYLTPKIIPIFTAPSFLQRVYTGGDALVSAPISENYSIYNLYGQGETCSAVCTHLIENTCKNPSLGKPLPGIEIRILDESGNDVSRGLEGEICVIGSFGVKYFKSPEATRKTFIKTDDGKTLVHTGDIGFIDDAGDLNYVTRKDWMVKINGQRVEILEVERVLQSVEYIREAAVKVFSDTNSQNYLVGYYVSDAELSIEDIRISLAEKLPPYMIPRYLVRLDTIPKNQNGKTDRNVLASPDISLYKTVYVAPSTPEEQALCSAFEEVLDCEKVGIHDDFFALGGDSIKVMKLLSAEPVKGLTLESIVKGKTPEAIAYLCTQPKEDAYQVYETYPFTQTQLGIFSECAANPESSIYNISSLYKLDDTVDIDKLKTAIITAVNAHPYIKMVLTISEDGDILAKRDDTAEVNIRIVDCDHLTKVQSLVRPFDILKFGSPLYRIAIYRTKDGNYLFTDFHHTICDGTSAGILLEDINQAYAGLAVENEKYTGFEVTIDEQRIRKSSRYSEAKEYYKKLLGTSASLSIIPYNTKKSTRAAIVSHVSQLDAESVKTYCLKHRITINTFCNTAFSLVLAKYTNSRNILYSTVYNGRNNPHYIRSVGMLVKTLPVVSRITDYSTFLELAAALQTELQNSMVHDCYSPADIVSESHAEIDDGIAFVYQGDSRKQIEIGGKPAAAVNLSPDTAKTALSIEVFVRSSKFELICQYRAGQYDDTLVNSILADIERTMREALDSSSLSEISVLHEKYQIHNAVPSANDNKNQNYITLFRTSVQQNADKPALVDFDGTRQTTYKELDRLSSCVAGKLHAAGCSKGSFIPVLIERRMEYMAAYLGVLKAGCVVVPLIPEIPQERISYIIEHCNAKLTIDISFFNDIESYEPFEDLAGDDEPALLIYTSGSTGTPKGILHTASSLAHASLRYAPFSQSEDGSLNFAAAAPLSFIAHVNEYLSQFLHGGAVHILSNTVLRSVDLLQTYFASHSIVNCLLPGQIVRCLTHPPDSLKKIVVTGEQFLNVPALKTYAVLYIYGQAETCGGVTYFVINKEHSRPPVGKTADETEILILDENGNRVLPGIEGEICALGNFGVSYFKEPELSAKTFIKTDDGKTLVHTGDIGFIDENGDLNYVTRKDWMVKINGQRVETLEVERILQSVEHIKEAVVKAFSDTNSQNYLVGYYVSDAELPSDDIRISLAEKLPPYMIPRYLVRLDTIPKNQNGKTDRNGLTSPDISLYKAVYVAPSTPEEQALCAAFEEVLDCEKVGIHDDFFALGGDSIKVMKLLAAEPVEGLTVDIIINGKTPEAIAYLCSAAEENNSAEDNHLDIYPLTRTQKEVAATCMRNPDAAMYNNPILCKLGNHTDIEKLKSAIITAVNAHPYIKATLITDESGELRAQRNDDAVHLSVITCDTLPDLQTFVRPFNLIESPLYRIEIYSSNDGIYLFTDFHHIICDGTSLMILLSDISKAYLGEDIAAESYTGFDAALTEEKARAGTKYQQDKEYYTKLLDGCDTDSTLYPDFLSDDEKIGITRHTCTADFEEVKKFCSKHNISENAFFNAVFSLVLSKYTDSTDVLYATIYNGRNDSRITRTFTMQIKAFPVFSQIQKDESFVQFAGDVQTRLLNGMAHDLYSFAEILASCRLNADTYFIYQADSFNPAEFAGEKITQIPLHPNAAKSALQIYLSVADNKLNLHGEFRTNTYSEFLIQSFFTSFDAVVKECLNVNLLSELSLITPAAVHLLNEFNATDAAYSTADTIIDGFHESVQKHQDKTAVVFKDTRLTYKELDEITDNLAEYLCKNGVGAETVVGILIPRNEYMPVCALGVLKAGGAYLPLDSTYPKDRLNFMLKDSSAVLLIVDKSLDGLIDEFSGKRLFTDDIKSLPNCSSLLPKPNAKDLFAVIYTSGSTGIPKGVMLTHQNIAAFSSAWIARSHELDETARVSAYASFGFDAAMQDMYPTLLCGAELHIIPEELRLDLIGLRTYFNTCRITHCDLTTQIGRQFALLGGFTSLKEQTVGGEKLVPFIPPSYAFYDTYGPTECTVVSTTFRLESQHTNSSIGKPLNNVRCYVVDKNGTLLPPGAVGELWLSGPQVARGYLNRPEKTAEVFTKNTFSTHPAHSVVYHTGDIVRYLSDGTLQFIGRHDSQVKIRGFRIELTEVEEVISRFTGIKDAAVAAYDSPAGGKYLAAYVVSDNPVDIKALNAFIAAEKPPYMVPAVTMQLDVLPHNQNMKVNRKALPVPELTAADAVPPQNELQQKLYDIVANVLGHSGFGITTSFSDAGLDSIRAVKLLMLLGNEFNIPIKYTEIRQCDTIEKLEEYIRNAEHVETDAVLSDYPLLETQKVIYNDCMQHPKSALYHIPTVIRLNENIDTLRLKAAVENAINAHPYLKSYLITAEDSTVRIKRNDDAEPVVSIIPVHSGELQNIKPRLYNLPESRLYDAVIYTAENENYLLLDVHHIIFDGMSLAILLRDIISAYSGHTLISEVYSGFDAANEEEKALTNGRYKRDKEYYDELFAGRDILSRLQAAEDVAGHSDSIRYVPEKLTVDAVRKYCAEHHLTENAFFNAAFGFVLSRYAGKPFVFSSLYHGRGDSRLINTTAMLAKRLPVLCLIPNDGTPAEFILSIQKQIMNSMEHDICSYSYLNEKYGINADVILRYQGDGFTSSVSEIGEVVNQSVASGAFEELLNQYEIPMSSIGVSIFIDGGQFEIIAHKSDVYSREFIEKILVALENTALGFLSDLT